MHRSVIVVLLSVMLVSWTQAQNQAEAAPEQAQGFWVSASYGLPQSFVVGAGARHIIGNNIGARVNIAITDSGAARFNLEPTYYLNDLIGLPELVSLYATLGPTLLVASPLQLGVQANIGAEYSLKAIDFEAMALFAEVSGTAQFLPQNSFYLGAKLGIRVHF